ncbi:MAG: alkaline phosphatase D, partial [Planctomycetota bacterium]
MVLGKRQFPQCRFHQCRFHQCRFHQCRFHLGAVGLMVLSLLSACSTGGHSAQDSEVEGPELSPPEQRGPEWGERTWLGPTMWGNRLQDWRNREGLIECVTPASSQGGWLGMRTAHELSRRVDARAGEFEVSVLVHSLTSGEALAPDAYGGLLIGAGGAEMDPRSAALIHQWSGNGGGVSVGFDTSGVLVIRDNSSKVGEDQGEVRSSPASTFDGSPFILHVGAHTLVNGNVRIDALVSDEDGAFLTGASRTMDAQNLVGNVAVVSHPGTRSKDLVPARFGFKSLAVSGPGSVHDTGATLGAIAGTQYTLSRGVLKLTAQLMPMGSEDPQLVTLELWKDSRWQAVAEEPFIAPGWTATFRVPDWDDSRDQPFRVVYAMSSGRSAAPPLRYSWNGTIARDPVDKEDIVLAVLNCNHNNSHAIGGGWGLGQAPDRTPPNDWQKGIWFPHAEISEAVVAREPDLLFFAGDQIYEGKSPTFADRANIKLDYLY